MNTPSQQKAIDSPAPALCLIAGAGSGKTKTLTSRIARLIKTGAARPHEILVLTFTRKAAFELKDRLLKLIDRRDVQQIWAGTFHGISYRILSQWGEKIGYRVFGKDRISVVSPEESDLLFNQVVEEYQWRGRKKDIEEAALKLAHQGVFPDNPDIARIIREYWNRLRECNAVDYDQILLEVQRLFRESSEARDHFKSRFKWVFVDEYQDTDRVQYNLHEEIGAKNLFVVGDPRQAIYSWRGADDRIIKSFSKDHSGAEVIDLLECFRCGAPILQAANNLISKNPEGEKPLVQTIEEGSVQVKPGGFEMLAKIISEDFAFQPQETIAVIGRTHAILKDAETALNALAVDTHRVGAETNNLQSSPEWKRLHAVLRMALNKKDSLAFMTYGCQWLDPVVTPEIKKEIMNRAGSAGIGMVEEYLLRFPENNLEKLIKTIKESPQLHILPVAEFILAKKSETEKSILKYISENSSLIMTPGAWLEWISTKDMHSELEKGKTGRVTLLTAHASKGLEWETVFLVGFEDGVFPGKRSMSPAKIEEERRLAYVAMTRAKKNLIIMFQEKPSRFISEAGLSNN